MPVATTTALLIGGALAGGIASSVAASEAADAQKDAAMAGMDATERARVEARNDLRPYVETGYDANALMADLYGFNGPEAQTAAQGRFRTDPGYQFQMSEGLRAVEGSAAARGSALSGGTLQALQSRGQGIADQSYGNWYSRLSDMGRQGQASAAGSADISQRAGAQTAALWGDYGAARAGGALGVGGSISDSLSGAMKAYGYGAGRYGGGGDGSGYMLPTGEPRGYYVRA